MLYLSIAVSIQMLLIGYLIHIIKAQGSLVDTAKKSADLSKTLLDAAQTITGDDFKEKMYKEFEPQIQKEIGEQYEKDLTKKSEKLEYLVSVMADYGGLLCTLRSHIEAGNIKERTSFMGYAQHYLSKQSLDEFNSMWNSYVSDLVSKLLNEVSEKNEG